MVSSTSPRRTRSLSLTLTAVIEPMIWLASCADCAARTVPVASRYSGTEARSTVMSVIPATVSGAGLFAGTEEQAARNTTLPATAVNATRIVQHGFVSGRDFRRADTCLFTAGFSPCIMTDTMSFGCALRRPARDVSRKNLARAPLRTTVTFAICFFIASPPEKLGSECRWRVPLRRSWFRGDTRPASSRPWRDALPLPPAADR